ncbi:MAG: hypothetical protein HQM03_22025 [Magnetococcales bacterium]|nr:hypothetical protein [Magnetococcales bacterium]
MKNPRVLIFYQRNWGIRFGQYLCERILSTHADARFSALIFKNTARAHLERQQAIAFERTWYWEAIMEDPDGYLAGETLTLREILADLEIDSIWPLVQSMRFYVKDYARKYYYAFTQSTPDHEIKKLIACSYKLIREMLDVVQPNVVIMPNAVALPHLLMLMMARKRGIFIRTPTETKISGYNMWISDHNDSQGIVFDQYRRHAHTPVEDLPCHAEAQAYLSIFRERFIQQSYVTTIAQDEGEPLKKLLNPLFYLKMFELALRRRFRSKDRVFRMRAMHIDRLPPSILIRDLYCEYRYRRHANRLAYDPIPEEFLYFPLQFQPEQTIDVVAPYFNNQLEAARLAAMSLPGDLTLVVKDHPAMAGKRTPGYLYKLQHQVNIALVDYRTPTRLLLSRARGVIAPSGTTLVEAALMNKPGIQFGNLGVSLLFPQIRQCTDFTGLAGVIKSHILGFDPSDPELDRALLRYIAVAMEYGFKMDYGAIWEAGAEGELAPMWIRLQAELDAWLAT